MPRHDPETGGFWQGRSPSLPVAERRWPIAVLWKNPPDRSPARHHFQVREPHYSRRFTQFLWRTLLKKPRSPRAVTRDLECFSGLHHSRASDVSLKIDHRSFRVCSVSPRGGLNPRLRASLNPPSVRSSDIAQNPSRARGLQNRSFLQVVSLWSRGAPSRRACRSQRHPSAGASVREGLDSTLMAN